MGARAEAVGHLRKAEEFLVAARSSVEVGACAPAVSAAVIAGINAKDAICLVTTGRTGKSDHHPRAAAELASSGPQGTRLAPTLRRLLSLKSKAQYGAGDMTQAQAANSIRWASTLVESARNLVRAA